MSDVSKIKKVYILSIHKSFIYSSGISQNPSMQKSLKKIEKKKTKKLEALNKSIVPLFSQNINQNKTEQMKILRKKKRRREEGKNAAAKEKDFFLVKST